jgi:hypothetical protein
MVPIIEGWCEFESIEWAAHNAALPMICEKQELTNAFGRGEVIVSLAAIAPDDRSSR